MQALEKHQGEDIRELQRTASLLQRVLAIEPDNPKLATVLAVDMFLVGIDTVR